MTFRFYGVIYSTYKSIKNSNTCKINNVEYYVPERYVVTKAIWFKSLGYLAVGKMKKKFAVIEFLSWHFQCLKSGNAPLKEQQHSTRFEGNFTIQDVWMHAILARILYNLNCILLTSYTSIYIATKHMYFLPFTVEEITFDLHISFVY
jgi:hypothetical protein